MSESFDGLGMLSHGLMVAEGEDASVMELDIVVSAQSVGDPK